MDSGRISSVKKQSQSHCTAKFGYLFSVWDSTGYVAGLKLFFSPNNLKYINLMLVERKKLKILFGAV